MTVAAAWGSAMTSVVAHRGPDADGFFVGPGIGLGHRRLSIIDLSTGDQPLTNEDRTIWVVFNGEIYNFADIRSELETFGHRFRTHSDTEVIVHAYEQWGRGAIERLRGMFGLAIWNTRTRSLLVARDRIGIKPLYYATVGGRLYFGSEIKSLLEDPAAARRTPSARRTSRAARALPAHDLSGGRKRGATAGRARPRQDSPVGISFAGDGDPSREAEYLDRLDQLVTESVRLRLVSDVPLGAFLSGGIDSSAVVAAMAEACAGRVVTTSVGFNEHAYDELEYARTVARHLGVEQHERIVHPGDGEIVDLLPKLAWHLDEPFADSSAVPTYYVSKAARERSPSPCPATAVMSCGPATPGIASSSRS
jgi:asparagine synthase (glutamine-hydrolysing)